MVPGRRDSNGESTKTRIDTLKVPGARLHYEARGAGPVLLMIPGGPADAGAFAGIAGRLADKYTVAAYDPRGNSRSSLDGPPVDWRADVQSDDASRLLAAVGSAPAYVLGSSGGTQIGLDLAARHPVFLAHGLRQISGYRPEVSVLRAGSTRIVVGVGDASRGQLAHRAGVELAERLGTNVVHFPGDHAGYGTHPAAFAETLHNVLTGR
jgi:hypothetical protein